MNLTTTLIRIAVLLSLCVPWLGTAPRTCAAEPAAGADASPVAEEARQKVLDSQRWKTAQRRFHEWLAVQTTYSDAEVAEIKQRLAARIAAMSADELQTFLTEMEQRLDVLLSPTAAAARSWVDQFYTQKGKQELDRKYGITDPIDMSAQELTAALDRFAEDRQSQGSSQAAFQKQQTIQAAAATKERQAQQAATRQAAAAAPPRPATFGTPYAPRRDPRPQRYQAPYDPVRYSIGPWGGVWINSL
ncbi:MAG: hypothetical protein KDA44_10710 [Planctomycetales bacterium]|nr:hypothetical protein [Planctomycetales bacterium]